MKKKTPRNRTAFLVFYCMHPLTPESTQKQKRGKSSYLFFFSFFIFRFFSSLVLSFLPFFTPSLPFRSSSLLSSFHSLFPYPLSSSLSPLTLHHVASRCCRPSSGPGSSRWIKGRSKDPLSTQNRVCANGPYPCLLSLPQGCLCFRNLEREGPSLVREIPIP